MKINYDLKLQELINNLDYKPTLLLHSCCGPCSSYVISYLKDYFKITVIYYNPNIEPIEEYNKRKSEQLRLLKELNIDYIDSPYENDLYHEEVKGHEEDVEGGNRCHLCYELRIKKTYLYAKENNFEYFGTTLTVSPYKTANIINEIGSKIADSNCKWLYSDFKKRDGYKKSIELSYKYNLYRQNYCGCTYSRRVNNDREESNIY